MLHQLAFNQTLQRFCLSAKFLSKQSGVAESTISGFRKQGKPISTKTLEPLIVAMPVEARTFFYSQLAQIREDELVQLPIDSVRMESSAKIEQLLELISQLSLEERGQLLKKLAEKSGLSVQVGNQSHSSHTIFQINLSGQKSDAVVDAIAKRISESEFSDAPSDPEKEQ